MKTLFLFIAMTLAVSAQTMQLVQPNDWSLNIAQGTGAAPGGPAAVAVAATHALVMPRKMAVKWQFEDETRVWLSIINTNHRDYALEGWHPNWTCILTHYKPIVKKLKDGQYEITFTTDLTEALP
jgi:hypothetical protein